jgi:dihydropteroate synthase
MHPRTPYRIAWGRHLLDLGRRTCVMGVVNVTPDSFSDGGKFYRVEDAVARGVQMAAEGADIIDVGGESTRPYAEAVTAEDERDRVLPVIAGLVRRVSVPISIDTTKSAVARRALAAGAAMVNDVSALRFDPQLAAVAAEFDVPLILMHMAGEPRTMQVAPRYEDLVGEIRDFLAAAVAAAERGGVARSRLIVDPGIGFGKTPEHNLQLIRRLGELSDLDMPLLIGTSRKSFIRKLLKAPSEKDISPDLPLVEIGTQASVTAAVLNGAHIVRVHDVANTVATCKIVDAILSS